jgi:hypothetical protein
MNSSEITKADRATSIVTEDLMIDSDTPGIGLHLRHRRHGFPNSFSAQKTLLMMHGARFASHSLYDVPLDGVSFLDFAALQPSGLGRLGHMNLGPDVDCAN